MKEKESSRNSFVTQGLQKMYIPKHMSTSSCCATYCLIQSAWDCWRESTLSSSLRPLILMEIPDTSSSSMLPEEYTDGVQSSRAVDMIPIEPPAALQLVLRVRKSIYQGSHEPRVTSYAFS